jgi:hypothetical protein
MRGEAISHYPRRAGGHPAVGSAARDHQARRRGTGPGRRAERTPSLSVTRGHAAAILHGTETGSGRIRGIPGCSKASSRITAGQKDVASWYVAIFQLPAGCWRDPHRLVSHLIFEISRQKAIRKTSLSWSPVTESNRRPSPYHLGACRSLKVVSAGQDPNSGPCRSVWIDVVAALSCCTGRGHGQHRRTHLRRSTVRSCP